MSETITNKPQSHAERLVLHLWDILHRDGADVSGFLNMLHTVVMRREWADGEFPRFVHDELQTTPEELLKIICLRHRNEAGQLFDAEKAREVEEIRTKVRDLLHPAIAQNGEIGRGRNSCDNVTAISSGDRGNAPAYALRRLKRDRPDLAARVLAGEMSAHAAAVEAGFRNRQHTIPQDPQKAVAVLTRHFDREELEHICIAILKHLGLTTYVD